MVTNTKEFISKTTCNTNVVIVRLDRTIQCLLDSPIKSGNDDYVALLMVLLVSVISGHLSHIWSRDLIALPLVVLFLEKAGNNHA